MGIPGFLICNYYFFYKIYEEFEVSLPFHSQNGIFNVLLVLITHYTLALLEHLQWCVCLCNTLVGVCLFKEKNNALTKVLNTVKFVSC
ncbi:unnamed protein product [Camellia sinensis]